MDNAWSSFNTKAKVRHDTPSPELVRMRTLKLQGTKSMRHVSMRQPCKASLRFKYRICPSARLISYVLKPDTAELHFDDLLSGAMNGARNYPLASDSQPPRKANVPAAVNGAPDKHTPPRRQSLTYNGIGTPPRLGTRQSSYGFPPSEPTEDANPADGSAPGQWSSAVGRAATGKSGRVIERLQAENDRLRRELKLETLHREEEEQKSELARGQMQSLQVANDNLAQMHDLNTASLARKDRKIDELRGDLEEERSRRAAIENQLKAVMREGETVEAELRGKLREESERAKRALGQYEVLSSSWRHMDEDYRRRAEKLLKDLTRLRTDSAEDRKKLERLAITVEQQRQEVDKMRVAKDAVVSQFETFKLQTEEGAQTMRARAESNEKANSEILEEADRVLGQMRYVINVRQSLRDAD